ncbi:hypothetical protein CDAR_55691 [Caerostris darwini]|uniref:Uncharacterized protein n=1 Tax=Caerostris darwini TaxID=1538125 RepID=A0AAV4W5R7_9ARAC|nr:hypothetical protein CDAR_55691 [Caerostris darwini]
MQAQPTKCCLPRKSQHTIPSKDRKRLNCLSIDKEPSLTTPARLLLVMVHFTEDEAKDISWTIAIHLKEQINLKLSSHYINYFSSTEHLYQYLITEKTIDFFKITSKSLKPIKEYLKIYPLHFCRENRRY